jgi:beta-glucosidase-like glycosyl hydrolase
MAKHPIIFGISGPTLTQEERDFFLANQIYGFILFKRNIESKEQLENLVNELKNLYPDDKPLVFVDQEGGRVARMKPPIVKNTYPHAEFFANIYDKDGAGAAAKAVRANYENLMQDLKDFGIDSPCAPVLDLRYSFTDNVIGDRSFGSDLDKVEALAKAAIEGIKKKGGIPVIKHIPGHGRATTDSHHDLPVVTASLEELNKSDFEIFKRLAKDAKYAMSAHIIFEALDPDFPVTLSKKAINFIRNEIGFNGILMTDAIEMIALHKGVDVNDKDAFSQSLAKAASSSLEAGCDIVLHCTGNLEQMIVITDSITT